ncbi:MAG: hypothetical protein ABI158_03105 [Edaphobacter sp.]
MPIQDEFNTTDFQFRSKTDPALAPAQTAFQRLDWFLLAIILIAAAFPFISALRHPGTPLEDALMLLRYSEHVAQGHGITWNVGEKPVEGATDFLYMMAVAAISKVSGLEVIASARLLISACWLLLPPVIFVATRRTLGGNRWLCAALALYMSAGPAHEFISTCYGATVAALAVAITWWFANELIYRKISWWASIGMALSALTLGLIRPEGNFLAIFILLAVLFKRRRQSGPVVISFLAVFASLGLGYFLWRWHYFGHPLPNPFYVKGDGRLYPDGLKHSIANVIKMLWPAIPIFFLALRKRQSRSNLLALMIPLVLFTGIWILLSNENNNVMRFQFPLVPLVLLSLPTLTWGLSSDLKLPAFPSLSGTVRLALIGAGVSSLLICMAVFQRIYPSVDIVASGISYPTYLSQFASKGYTMAVTEAGQFPFYSKWKAIDTLGLNDAHIAHHGISEQYLDEYKPELILYHADSSFPFDEFQSELYQTGRPRSKFRDVNAVRVMHSYALHHNYILAAAYASINCSFHFFWVRPGTADTDAIVNYIRTTPYYFIDNGILSSDFQNNLPKYPCKMDSHSTSTGG